MDISEDGVHLVSKIAELFRVQNIDSQIIVASVRHPDHVTRLPELILQRFRMLFIEQLVKHPLTEQGIEKFAAC